jgi:hypothetical protein
MEKDMNKLKKDMSKMADDEYYAGLASIIERDPLAKKYFNVDDITYPLMDKSKEYNIKGFVSSKDPKSTENYLKKTGIDKYISPESTFTKKTKEGKEPIAILQEPIATGSSLEDISKIRTIMHESRHKALKNKILNKFLTDNKLDEEVFIRFLDKKIYPEIETELPTNFTNPKKSFKKYENAVDDFLKLFK